MNQDQTLKTAGIREDVAGLVVVQRKIEDIKRDFDNLAWSGIDSINAEADGGIKIGKDCDAIWQHLDNASGRTSTLIDELRRIKVGANVNRDKMAERIARTVLGGGKWVWEIKDVDSQGALLQVVWDSGARYVKWSEIAKEAGEMKERIKRDLAIVAREGLKLNISAIGEAEVVVEDGKIKVFANVMVRWLYGTKDITREDVEENMTEAGLLSITQ